MKLKRFYIAVVGTTLFFLLQSCDGWYNEKARNAGRNAEVNKEYDSIQKEITRMEDSIDNWYVEKGDTINWKGLKK